jgi:hypothetical protein
MADSAARARGSRSQVSVKREEENLPTSARLAGTVTLLPQVRENLTFHAQIPKTEETRSVK